ncbi:MAG: Ribosomal large subunit pseudouridine synthase C [Pelotomaculum sp. PtaB.Bin117]|nr:MAG: Ribosomal large subunit pseudouridine synthase C [Pelotomaculum sp. PtaB.Bin117]OPY59622.1 MAG: Ribosomal large subunit pseudouridine synthase C [Pelotomaculum sp. PtaU1.Bin065]
MPVTHISSSGWKPGVLTRIRVHLAYIGHLVVDDPKYGPTRPHFGLDGQFLHAAALGFKHPRTGSHLEFEAPLPDDLKAILEKLTMEKGKGIETR